MMPATPVTTEARAVAGRLRQFPALEGNTNYLRKLIYEDSLTATSLIAELEAVDPPVDEAMVQALYKAASTCGSVGECGGNIAMWPLTATAADSIEAACDAIEDSAEAKPKASRKPARR
jgi:hypothetical protein